MLKLQTYFDFCTNWLPVLTKSPFPGFIGCYLEVLVLLIDNTVLYLQSCISYTVYV